MLHGIAVHENIEKYLKNQPCTIIAKYQPMLEAVSVQARDKKLMVEARMGVLGNLEPCGFFHDHVYGRGAADALIIDYPNAFLLDWKTGKVREKRDQLAILALFVFKHFPKVNKITACNIWLEAGKYGDVYVFDRASEAGGWLTLLEKIRQVEDAIARNVFCMMPGPLCGYCPVKICPNNRS